MRCPYCGTENDETADRCRKCSGELSQARSQWKGPQGQSGSSTPQQISSASDQWDPAKRFSEPRTASAFVPQARYPTHVSWIITVLLIGVPATAIHAVLFWRGIEYPNNLGIAVWVVLACCLPMALAALICSGLVNLFHRAGSDANAYRCSRTSGLLLWIALIASLALYVILFLRLMSNISDFWVY